jgi:prevent-host-death family protein
MKRVGCNEAKTHLPRLLVRVQKGETITITKYGRPIAKIVPAAGARQGVAALVEEMLAFRDERGDSHCEA